MDDLLFVAVRLCLKLRWLKILLNDVYNVYDFFLPLEKR